MHRAELFLRNKRVTVRVTRPDGSWETAMNRIPIVNFTPFVARYGFGGRTGGLTNEHWIDNVSIAVPSDLDRNGNRVLDTCECVADVDNGTNAGVPDGGVDINDLLYYLALFNAGGIDADIDGGAAPGTPDGGVDISDLLYFLTRFDLGC